MHNTFPPTPSPWDFSRGGSLGLSESFKPRTLEEEEADKEAGFRKRLPDGHGKCVVGVFVNDNGARWGGNVWNYTDAIVRAGAEPHFICPGRGPIEKQLAGVDALVIPGGPDIDRKFYGHEGAAAEVEKAAQQGSFDAFEIRGIKQALAEGIPMLGICRGLQLMNVAGDGTLIGDIPSQWQSPNQNHIQHRYAGDHGFYSDPNSTVGKLIGDRVKINSLHHQCIGHLSPQFRVVGIAADFVIEAIEHQQHAAQIGVQFHPESMRTAGADNLFRYVIDYAAAHPRQRVETAAAPGEAQAQPAAVVAEAQPAAAGAVASAEAQPAAAGAVASAEAQPAAAGAVASAEAKPAAAGAVASAEAQPAAGRAVASAEAKPATAPAGASSEPDVSEPDVAERPVWELEESAVRVARQNADRPPSEEAKSWWRKSA
jgi:putative glutamine amidotransferase